MPIPMTEFCINPFNRVLVMEEIIEQLEKMDPKNTGYFICNVINYSLGKFRIKYKVLYDKKCVGKTINFATFENEVRLSELLPELVKYRQTPEYFKSADLCEVWFYVEEEKENMQHIKVRINALRSAINDINNELQINVID